MDLLLVPLYFISVSTILNSVNNEPSFFQRLSVIVLLITSCGCILQLAYRLLNYMGIDQGPYAAMIYILAVVGNMYLVIRLIQRKSKWIN